MPAVRYTVRARRDLIEIWLEASEANPAAADDVYNWLEARVKILRRFPKSGPLRPDMAPGARTLVEFPYLILYRISVREFRLFASCTARDILTGLSSRKG